MYMCICILYIVVYYIAGGSSSNSIIHYNNYLYKLKVNIFLLITNISWLVFLTFLIIRIAQERARDREGEREGERER